MLCTCMMNWDKMMLTSLRLSHLYEAACFLPIVMQIRHPIKEDMCVTHCFCALFYQGCCCFKAPLMLFQLVWVPQQGSLIECQSPLLALLGHGTVHALLDLCHLVTQAMPALVEGLQTSDF